MVGDGSKHASDRSCTCHPSDNPPQPCAKRYALQECREVAQDTEIASLRDRLAKAERTHDELMSKYADTQAWCLQWRDDKAKAEAAMALAVAECRAGRTMRDAVLSADESRLLMVACNGPGMYTENGKRLHERCDRIRSAVADFDTARAANPLPEAPRA